MSNLTKVITLTHATLKDLKGAPKQIQVVAGPGLTYFRSNEDRVTWIALTGGAVEVLETTEEITSLIESSKKGEK